jgi:hypothetical protein
MTRRHKRLSAEKWFERNGCQVPCHEGFLHSLSLLKVKEERGWFPYLNQLHSLLKSGSGGNITRLTDRGRAGR